jgi:hypothetical protein
VRCACPCGNEFEPKRSNQIYVNAEHRRRDSNRRWPVKRQSVLPAASRNGLGEHREAKTSYVTLLLGTQMAPVDSEALRREKLWKVKADSESGEMLTPSAVGCFLGVSRWTLWDWRRKRMGPPFVKLSRHVVRYPQTGLSDYLTSHLWGESSE